MEPSASESSAATDSDQDFDPSADMLVNDFDDEHTLDEEEALDDNTNASNEIDDLQREGEMPLEELLAMYRYAQPECNTTRPESKPDVTSSTSSNLRTDTSSSNSNDTGVQDQLTLPNTSHECMNDSNNGDVTQTKPIENDANLVPLEQQWILPEQSTSNHLNSLIGSTNEDFYDASDASDDEEDDEEDAIEDWRRTIQVGVEYQAYVPSGLQKYDDAPAYENEDKLLWYPFVLPDNAIVDYLKQYEKPDPDNGDENSESNGMNQIKTTSIAIPDTTLPAGCHIKDDEQALYLLLQCGHNVEEALRRKRMQTQQTRLFEPMSCWSEEECRIFEEGLRVHGKDFHQIHKNKVLTRSVAEIVHFYYLWKKTERHDIFASKWRIEKKKYSLHPGTTDYMDRFLDEQENLALQTHSLTSLTTYNQPEAITTRQQSHNACYSMIPQSYHQMKTDNSMDSLSSLTTQTPMYQVPSNDTLINTPNSTYVNGNNPMKVNTTTNNSSVSSLEVASVNGPDSSSINISSTSNVTSSTPTTDM